MDEVITKRLHVSGLTPAITPGELSQRLGSFGTIKALDGFGLLDAVGQPRKFGYVTLETTKKKVDRCMNILSGVTWKGAKLRIGEAKPDFRERIAKERAPEGDGEPPKKRRRLPRGVQGVHAADMSLVTPENAASRSGWHVTPTGRLVRPIRMRPEHPLPEPLASTASANDKKVDKTSKKKRKRVKEPPTRGRRRTIDPMKWGSQHLKGVFLESVVVASRQEPELDVLEDIQEDESDSDESESGSGIDDGLLQEPKETTTTIHHVHPASQPSPLLAPPPRPAEQAPPLSTVTDATHDKFLHEKQKTLGLLQSLFGDKGDGDWGGEESIGSDVELDDQPPRENSLMDEEPLQEAAMDVDQDAQDDVSTQTIQAPKNTQVHTTKLKDLFAPQEETGFSLLEQLDLDLELDDEVDLQVVQPQAQREIHPVAALPSVPSASALDPKRPLFFPLPPAERVHGRVHDVVDPTNWRRWFFRTDTSEDIQKRWEETRGELTSAWKRRHREAVKSRRRRGGGPGDGEIQG